MTSSTLLHQIGVQFQAVQADIGDMLLVVNDTERKVQTTVDVLSDVSTQVTKVYERVPELSDKLTALNDDVIPLFISMLKVCTVQSCTNIPCVVVILLTDCF